MKQKNLLILFFAVSLLYAGPIADYFKEDLESLIGIAKIGLPLLLFIGAPIIITLIIIGLVKSVSYAGKTTIDLFKSDENEFNDEFEDE